jgi:hypothetical protein
MIGKRSVVGKRVGRVSGVTRTPQIGMLLAVVAVAASAGDAVAAARSSTASSIIGRPGQTQFHPVLVVVDAQALVLEGFGPQNVTTFLGHVFPRLIHYGAGQRKLDLALFHDDILHHGRHGCSVAFVGCCFQGDQQIQQTTATVTAGLLLLLTV